MLPTDTGVEAQWRAERQAASDFRQARRKARLRSLGRRLAGRLLGPSPCCEICCEFLACFDEERRAFGKGREKTKEFETVELGRIVGSLTQLHLHDHFSAFKTE